MRYPLHDTVRTRTLRTRTLTELVDRLLFRAAQGNAGVPRGGGPLRDPTAAGPVSPGGRVTAFFTRLQYRRSATRWLRYGRLQGPEPDVWVPVPSRTVTPSPSYGFLCALQYRVLRLPRSRHPWRGSARSKSRISHESAASIFGPLRSPLAAVPGGPRGSPELQGVPGGSLGRCRGPFI